MGESTDDRQPPSPRKSKAAPAPPMRDPKRPPTAAPRSPRGAATAARRRPSRREWPARTKGPGQSGYEDRRDVARCWTVGVGSIGGEPGRQDVVRNQDGDRAPDDGSRRRKADAAGTTGGMIALPAGNGRYQEAENAGLDLPHEEILRKR